MSSGIYKIKNIINDKVYIGSSKNFKQREKQHFSSLKNNKHHSYKLQKSYNKYGVNNFVFEIIEFVEDKKLLDREQYYINLYNSFNIGYNCCESSAPNIKRTWKEVQKQIKLQKENDNFNKYNTEFNLLMDNYPDKIRYEDWWFKNRIINKCYKHSIYKKVVNAINWFLLNYPNNYHLYFHVIGNTNNMYIHISDNDDIRFACYHLINKKIIHSKSDTEIFMRQYLKNKVDPKIHYIIE